MKILTRDQSTAVQDLFDNERFFLDFEIFCANGYENEKTDIKSFIASSFNFKNEEEYSKADFVCYSDVVDDENLLSKYLLKEEKHLEFYKNLHNDDTCLFSSNDRIFFKFENLKEFEEKCRTIIREGFKIPIVFPNKKIVTEYAWDLGIQVFYYEETGYEYAKKLAADLGFYVFE